MASLDIYDSFYFRLNKQFLSALGLWPYASNKKMIRSFWVALLFAFNVPHWSAVLLDLHIDSLLEHSVFALVTAAAFLKHFTLLIAEEKMKSLYSDIANNWSMITDEDEKKILIDYAKRGRVITITYAGLIALAGMSFMLMPLVPEILNVIDPLPIPRAHFFILDGEFFVENRNDHFWKIYFWDSGSCLVIIMICSACDTTYLVIVEHTNSLCAIVTHRLSKLKQKIQNDVAGTSDSYDWLVHTIKLHQTVLSFTSSINDSYSACFFCLTLINLVDLPVVCVVVMMNWENPMNMIRYVMLFNGLMVHLFVLFWPGQKLIDHSIRFVDDAYSNEWYDTPIKTKMLLRIFMTRCFEPCSLSAVGLVDMNFEIYFSVVKTAVSYITVLASLR